MDEEAYKKELANSGVEVPELVETPEAEPKEEETPTEEPQQKEETPKVDEPLKEEEPKESRKRSIYDEYKEKKSELKSERELRESAERERDELKTKLEALSNADTPEEKEEAKDDLTAFAESIGADPEAIKKMKEIFLKDARLNIDESVKKDLEDIKIWKSQNSQAVEQQEFEKEFDSIKSDIKGYFPTIDDSEMNAVKSEIDKIAHTKGWEDKDLDYIVFKNKERLSNLVSPKKRGIESKGNKDITDDNFDFDPNADYSKLSPKEKELWEANYNKLGKQEGLVEDSQGRKIII